MAIVHEYMSISCHIHNTMTAAHFWATQLTYGLPDIHTFGARTRKCRMRVGKEPLKLLLFLWLLHSIGCAMCNAHCACSINERIWRHSCEWNQLARPWNGGVWQRRKTISVDDGEYIVTANISSSIDCWMSINACCRWRTFPCDAAIAADKNASFGSYFMIVNKD